MKRWATAVLMILNLTPRIIAGVPPGSPIDSVQRERAPENEPGLDAGYGITIEHRIQFSPTIQPERMCGSPVECGKVGVAIHSRCSSTMAGFAPDPSIYTIGRVHFFAGAIELLDKRPTADHSVRDPESIRAHVLRWHVDPAIAVIEPAIRRFSMLRFRSEEECQSASRDLSKVVSPLFQSAIHETQTLENQSVDVSVEVASGRFAARFDCSDADRSRSMPHCQQFKPLWPAMARIASERSLDAP